MTTDLFKNRYFAKFATNFSTVIFWNPDYWKLRPSAQSYFDELRRVDILRNTLESAPEIWWQNKHVQSVRVAFMNRYALGSNDWLKQWRKELLS